MTVMDQESARREAMLDRFSPDSTLTERAADIAKAVREYIPQMRASAAEAERRRELDPAVSQHLTDLGVFELGVPVEHGGIVAGARDLVEVMSAVGHGDGSAGWLTTTATNNNMLALIYPDEVLAEVFGSDVRPTGPRLIAASLFARQVGSARPVDGGWMVQGKWGFGSGCRTASWAIVGADYETADGRQGRGLALIPSTAYEILDDWQVSGMAATSSNSVVAAEEVFVPAERFVDVMELPARQGGVRERFSGAAYTWGDQARFVVITMNLAAVALGMAEGAVEALIAQAPKRTPFNLPYPTIADAPGTQIVVGRAQAAADAARAVIERVAEGIDRISSEGLDVSPVEANRLHMELVFAIKLCAEAISDAEMALGSAVAILSNPVQRYSRDIRVLQSHGAIRFDPLAELAGKDALGRTADMFAGGLPSVG